MIPDSFEPLGLQLGITCALIAGAVAVLAIVASLVLAVRSSRHDDLATGLAGHVRVSDRGGRVMRGRRRPEDVVQTVEERRHTLAALALVGLLTVVIFAVAAAADLGSWFVS